MMINFSVEISECKKKLKNTNRVKPKILADRRVLLYPNLRHLEVKNSPDQVLRRERTFDLDVSSSVFQVCQIPLFKYKVDLRKNCKK